VNQEDFQSYQVFFLSPGGDEFVVPEAADSYAEPEDPDAEDIEEDLCCGERTIGLAVGISLTAPVAVISPSSIASFEDGTFSAPTSTRRGCRSGRRKKCRTRKTTRRKRIRLLDETVLSIPLDRLREGEDVFLGQPLSLFDAFFFRGV
jgi:hypothetical protein